MRTIRKRLSKEKQEERNQKIAEEFKGGADIFDLQVKYKLKSAARIYQILDKYL